MRVKAPLRRLLPGDRRVWMAAGAAVLVLVIAGTVELLRPRDYYTGSNSVGGRSAVADVGPGSELCIGGLLVPAGTAQIQIATATTVPIPALRAELQPVGAAPATLTSKPQPVGTGKVTLRIPGPPARADAAARLCVSPQEGKLLIGGMAGLQGDQRAPTLDGHPLDARIAVWYRPEPGATRTLLEALPDIARRAALFRPGWVGPWTYWLLLFAVTPLLIYAALRLVALAAAGLRGRVPAALAIGLIAAANAAAFATMTPPFHVPDEPDHVAYTQILGETGHKPTATPGRGAFSTEEALALDGVRTYSTVELPDTRQPWTQTDLRRYQLRVPMFEPLNRADGGGNPNTAGGHRPGYYLLDAVGYLLGRGENFYATLWAMRLVSALLGGVAAACTVLFMRARLPRAPAVLAVVAGALVAFLPQFAFISGGVNNDAGVNAMAAVTLWLAARALNRGLDWRSALPLGIAAALLPFFKATGMALYPVVGLVALIAVLRRRDRAVALGVGALAAGGVIGRAVISFTDRTVTALPVPGPAGTAAPALVGANGVVSTVLDTPTLFLSYLWQTFLPRLPFMTDLFVGPGIPVMDTYIKEGFASFGWYAIEFAPSTYRAIVVVLVLVAVGAIAALIRHRRALPQVWSQLLLLVVAVAGVLAAVSAAYTSLSPRGPGELPEQGRYAFTALPAFAGLIALSCLGLPRRLVGFAAGGLVGALGAFFWASQFLLLLGYYA